MDNKVLTKIGEKAEWAPAAGTVNVDSEMSDTSTNPVQNKVIKSAIDALRFDVHVYYNLVTHAVSCSIAVNDIKEKLNAGFYPMAILTGIYEGQSFIIGYSIGFVNGPTEVIFYFFDSISEINKDGNNYSLAIQTIAISDSGATVSSSGQTLIKDLRLSGQTGIIMPSSTAGSSKKFRIKVDDSGTLSATEVTN